MTPNEVPDRYVRAAQGSDLASKPEYLFWRRVDNDQVRRLLAGAFTCFLKDLERLQGETLKKKHDALVQALEVTD